MLIGSFVGQNKYDYWSNIWRINYSHVESQEFNLNLHIQHGGGTPLQRKSTLLVRDRSVLIHSGNNDTLPHHRQLVNVFGNLYLSWPKLLNNDTLPHHRQLVNVFGNLYLSWPKLLT